MVTYKIRTNRICICILAGRTETDLGIHAADRPDISGSSHISMPRAIYAITKLRYIIPYRPDED